MNPTPDSTLAPSLASILRVFKHTSLVSAGLGPESVWGSGYAVCRKLEREVRSKTHGEVRVKSIGAIVALGDFAATWEQVCYLAPYASAAGIRWPDPLRPRGWFSHFSYGSLYWEPRRRQETEQQEAEECL